MFISVLFYGLPFILMFISLKIQRVFFVVVFSGIAKHDEEGRLITAEYDDFYLVGACK